MNVILGLVMAIIGLFMMFFGSTKSEFPVYRIFVTKSKPLWGENVHRFYQVSGLAVIVVGVLFALKILGK